MAYVDARCPLRPGDMCSLCVPGATGPQDCPTVAEVMRDPALRERLAELRREALDKPKGRPVASR
ncbi:hypothetical protein Pve01_87320 [Planomonospora venezuelensis]|nr:hypothetical protein Pve01_87320 [Planomonospora venezuelensis]